MDMPQYGITVQEYPDGSGRKFLGLQITTGATMHNFFLCDGGDYESAARQISEKIVQAGKQAATPQRRLIEVKGTLNGKGHLPA